MVVLHPETPFESCTVALGPLARLLVYSDGVFEIDRPGGGMWKLSDFLSFMGAFSLEEDDLPGRLHHAIRDLHGSDTLADSFSILEHPGSDDGTAVGRLHRL